MHLFTNTPPSPNSCSWAKTNLLYFCKFRCLFVFYSTYEQDHDYLSFSVWLIILSRMPSRFFQVVPSGRISFLCYGWITCYWIYTHHFSLWTNLPTDTGCFHVFAIVNKSREVGHWHGPWRESPGLSQLAIISVISWQVMHESQFMSLHHGKCQNVQIISVYFLLMKGLYTFIPISTGSKADSTWRKE